MEINTILVPVDLSTRTARELALAGELALATGARLVILHNEPAAPLGMSRAWDWEQQHPAHHGRGALVDHALNELLAQVPAGVAAEAVLSRGMPLSSIVEAARRLHADLIVLESAGPDVEDHSSIAERLLAESPCPVLALQEGHDRGRTLLGAASGDSTAEVLVATDFSAAADAAVHYALDLARRLPLRLRLLHVITSLAHTPAASIGYGDHAAATHTIVGSARERLLALVPADLRDRVTVQVVGGSASEAIVEACATVSVSFVVMGEHATGLRGLVTRDTARAVLRNAPCPVWYVPPAILAGAPR
jgi:nucleotide-binding universal stress UspA family protein